MSSYYFDIETTGLEPTIDSVITIQYQELERYTGKPIGDLRILKSWESSEQDILEGFVRATRIDLQEAFRFIPVGYNLGFENKFLYHRLGINIIDLPHIDLHHTAILMNRGEFRGSGLDRMSGKPHSGSPIPGWHSTGQYHAIVEYVEREAAAFCDFYMWLLKCLPLTHQDFIMSRS